MILTKAVKCDFLFATKHTNKKNTIKLIPIIGLLKPKNVAKNSAPNSIVATVANEKNALTF